MEVQDTLSPLPGVVDIKTDPIKKTAVVRVVTAKFDSQAAIEKLAAAHFENSTVAKTP